jgi:cytochrome c nitrite reductase small subunit
MTKCHVLQEYFDAWLKSAHRSVATCNDCHTPHNFIGKYATKMENGFFHSLAFTSGRFPDNILVRPRDYRVAQGTCRSCHSAMGFQADQLLGEVTGRSHQFLPPGTGAVAQKSRYQEG